ncbi:hypothetical protein OBBRIDRAFT_835429 [Obba rivulosa]|uniref:Uncharacterized protein n=1 Tax=Obba rivulosa TaxID=1052685 RepID=A0A8E2ATA5_9APHY|nr:hypothetical protein OBBRIDRAFT_835429 [Obba rivulosa]
MSGRSRCSGLWVFDCVRRNHEKKTRKLDPPLIDFRYWAPATRDKSTLKHLRQRRPRPTTLGGTATRRVDASGVAEEAAACDAGSDKLGAADKRRVDAQALAAEEAAADDTGLDVGVSAPPMVELLLTDEQQEARRQGESMLQVRLRRPQPV